MDENGEISEAAHGVDRTTAEKHTNGGHKDGVSHLSVRDLRKV